MSERERDFDARIRRLLRSGKPAYPENLDRRLRERISRIDREARPLPRSWSIPRWCWAATAAAAVLLVVGLLWWPGPKRPGPGMAPVSAAEDMGRAEAAIPGQGPAAALATSRSVPAVAAKALAVPRKIAAQMIRKKDRSGQSPGTVGTGPVRLEFIIPERQITILWEQRGDFDLTALVAVR